MSDLEVVVSHDENDNVKKVRSSSLLDFIEKLPYYHWMRRPIHIACQKGYLKTVKIYLQNKSNIECEDRFKLRPIHYACARGHLEIVKLILKHKCNIECEDQFKWRPIHYACWGSYLEIARLLLQNKCNIECENIHKRRPIHWACKRANLQIVKLLLQNNCSIECEDKWKLRPIHFACAKGSLEIIKLLCQRNCELDCRSSYGKTPIEIVRGRGDKSSEEYLNEILKRREIFDCVRRNDIQALSILYTPAPQMMEEHKTVLSLLEIALESRAYEIINYILSHFCNNEILQQCLLDKTELNFGKVKFCDGHGCSLLHMAVKTLQPDLCNISIKSGVNIQTINDHRNSPLFELFSNVDIQHDNVEKAIEILNILVESGLDVNEITKPGMSVLQRASQCNSERLMIFFLTKLPQIKCITKEDFKLAFTNHWFEYASTLISFMTDDSLQTFITNELFHLALPHADPKLLMSLFMKSTPMVHQLVIEDLLDHFALIDEYNAFVDLLNIEIIKPKLFTNGETLLTNLLKNKNLKYCWAIINCTANKKYIVLTNNTNENPLKIAIETELFDFMNPLIFNCEDELNLGFNWHDPLIPLFQKLSMSNNNVVDQKLLAAIKATICRGGNIYKEIFGGSAIINYCTRPTIKEELKIFEDKLRSKDLGEKKVCSICLEVEVNCAFLCGHTFCLNCGEQLSRCAICNSEATKLIKLYFN